jgi:7-cyano-7-deazaguanine reductase
MNAEILQVFPNPKPGRDFVVIHSTPEFTSVCPVTGQPDFADIEVAYVPNELCVELKSLKLYFQSFRNDGIFYEAVTNQLLDDLAALTQPKWMRVTGTFNVRGGFGSIIVAETGPQPDGIAYPV